jgi:hypothetical protein
VLISSFGASVREDRSGFLKFRRLTAIGWQHLSGRRRASKTSSEQCKCSIASCCGFIRESTHLSPRKQATSARFHHRVPQDAS